jgi:ABC-type Mn2+/Zn2+ transport system permease subunit
MLVISAIHAALSAILGLHLGVWLRCSIGAAMVVAGALLFTAAWAMTGFKRLVFRRQAAADAMAT